MPIERDLPGKINGMQRYQLQEATVPINNRLKGNENLEFLFRVACNLRRRERTQIRIELRRNFQAN